MFKQLLITKHMIITNDNDYKNLSESIDNNNKKE